MTKQMSLMLLDNVEVSIQRVHVRYEGRGAAGPLALGIRMEELNAYNCDANWTKAFSKDLKHIIRTLEKPYQTTLS